MRPLVLLLVGIAVACGGRDDDRRIGEVLKTDDGTAKREGDRLLEVPPFKLLERGGTAVGNAELRGRVWVAAFIFTTCQTHCLTICGALSRLQDEFEDDDDFRIVATTVDPATDTVEVLRAFGKKWSARPDRWLFLTGRREDIKKFAYDGLKISWNPEEPLVHSTRLVLVDREGWIRAWFDGADAGDVQKLRAMVRKLLDDKGRA